MAKPPTYERKALEKIWNVLQEIEEQRLLSPEGAELRLFVYPPGFHGTGMALELTMRDRGAVMDKLHYLGAIEIVETVRGLDGG